MLGCPARQVGWVGRDGHELQEQDGVWVGADGTRHVPDGDGLRVSG